MVCYANLFLKGNGVPMNKQKAIKYLNMAIEKGNDAINTYGLMLQNESGAPANYEEANRLYKIILIF